MTLIGQPTAVAEPVTEGLLQAYKTWLHYEHRFLSWQIANSQRMVRELGGTPSERFNLVEPAIAHTGIGEADHFHAATCNKQAPSARAALVLSAVGCDWREHQR